MSKLGLNNLAVNVGYWAYLLIAVILLATGTFPLWVSWTVMLLVFGNLAFQLVVLFKLLRNKKAV